ncbi:Uma2 family endonuclease [Paenibacillus sp. P26]|nr:Uma2 family endonuclease [Paenibacillus sp. P26]UUZ89816.1 Uma2 family endonuclease [Paenibacillus sp. P25]
MSMYPIETDERYEIWGGQTLMMTPSNTDHGFIKNNLSYLITAFVKKNSLGKVYDAEVPIYLHGDLTRKDFRLADLSFVALDRLDIVQYKGIYGAPDFTLEILSPGKTNVDRDRVEKYRLYEQYGVKEYWIVSPGRKV